MKKIFYGVYASNGLGIYTNYAKYVNDRRFMRGERIKGFSGRDDAVGFAIDGFDSLRGMEKRVHILSNVDDLRLNFFYFHRKESNNRCEGGKYCEN